jgi:hypothetical protein
MVDVWFKKKKIGWGYYPSSKEGWLITGLYLILAILLGVWYEGDPAVRFKWFISGLILMVGVLIILASRHSEKS